MNVKKINHNPFRKVWIISATIFIISTVLLPSCRIIKEPEFKKLQKVKLSQIGLIESTLTAELVFFNPNKFGYKIKSFEAEIEMNNRGLGRTVSTKETDVAKMASFYIPVELKVNMRNIPINSWNLLTKDSVMFSAKGFVLVGKKGLYKQVAVDYKGNQKIDLNPF